MATLVRRQQDWSSTRHRVLSRHYHQMCGIQSPERATLRHRGGYLRGEKAPWALKGCVHFGATVPLTHFPTVRAVHPPWAFVVSSFPHLAACLCE